MTHVFTNGVFDLFHVGHLRMLRAASSIITDGGVYLTVAINDDTSVARIRGEDRPIIPCEHRRELLLGLYGVRHVITFSEDTACEIIEFYHRQHPIDVYVKGDDTEELPEEKILCDLGIEIRFLETEKPDSASQIIERCHRAYQRGMMPVGSPYPTTPDAPLPGISQQEQRFE